MGPRALSSSRSSPASSFRESMASRKRRPKKPAPSAMQEVTGFYVKVPVPDEVLELGSKLRGIVSDVGEAARLIDKLTKKLGG